MPNLVTTLVCYLIVTGRKMDPVIKTYIGIVPEFNMTPAVITSIYCPKVSHPKKRKEAETHDMSSISITKPAEVGPQDTT